MPIFQYQAINQEEKSITGLVEAANESAAAEILEEKGCRVFSLQEKSRLKEFQIPFLNSVKPKDIVIFSRQFAVLISANIAIVESLKILTNQTENAKLKKIVNEVSDSVDGGNKLSNSLEKYPKIFSNFFVNVVRSGESSGKLDEVLNYLADEMEKDYDLMSKIKGAMIYPAFIITGLSVVGIIMMVSVIPKLTDIMAETGGELPIATRILIATSDFLQNFWYILIILIIGITAGYRFAIKTETGKFIIDRVKLKLPIFGRLFNRIYLVRFTRSLNTLIVGGVPISQGLKIAADVINNEVYKELIYETKREVEDGNSISTSLIESDRVPKMVSQMLSIGEETGKLDLVLTSLTEFYSKEIKGIIDNLTVLLEPIIMVIIGVAVGIMVAAVIMPMYNMATQM